MKKLNKDQRGLTLIELVIAIALVGVITGGITMTILQVFTMNTRTSNHMTAVRQVQHAGFWVSPDVQMALSVNASAGSGFPLTLIWLEGGSNDVHEVIYTLEDMPSGGFERLQREHYIESELDSTTIVAEYIDPAETSCCCDCDDDGACDGDCTCDDKSVIFTVTATVGGQSETRIYEIKPRPGSY